MRSSRAEFSSSRLSVTSRIRHAGVELMRREAVAHVLDDVAVVEITARHVDRYAQAVAVRDLALQARQVRAGALQHPLRHRHDLPGLFGERNEIGRHHEAARRVAPAHQRLDADEVPRTQIDDGLVVRLELAAIDGGGQFVFDAHAPARRAQHLGLEDFRVALAARLRRVHGGIGIAQQPLDIADAIGDRDADAAADAQRPAVDVERLPAGVEHLARDRHRRLDVRARDR